MPVNRHLSPPSRPQPLLRQLQGRAGTALPWLSFTYVAETQRRGQPLTCPPCISRAWSGSWPAPARSRPHPRALSLAQTGLTHLGRVARVGRPQRAEGREEAGPALPPTPGQAGRRRQGAGETVSDLSRELSPPGLAASGPRRAGPAPQPPSPTRAACGDSAWGRGCGGGFSPGDPRGPLARSGLRAAPASAADGDGGAAPSAGDTRQAEVSAGGRELGEGERRTLGAPGTTRQRWPGS